MINSVMFFIGLGIVLVYTFFLLRIILKQNKTAKQAPPSSVDVMDLDGMGNQGRIPNKKGKNRA